MGTDPSPKMINKMNTDIKEKKIAFLLIIRRQAAPTVKSFVNLAKRMVFQF